jgi:hypothetical protein
MFVGEPTMGSDDALPPGMNAGPSVTGLVVIDGPCRNAGCAGGLALRQKDGARQGAGSDIASCHWLITSNHFQ